MLGPNYNYDLENQRIQQQQKIIDAMQAGALKPMEVPNAGAGQTQARLNPLAAIMPALQEALLNHARDNAKSKQDELGARYKQDLVDGMQNFYDKSSGGWDHNQTAASPDTDITMANPTDSWNYRSPDMKGAITDALASNSPVVQQMGQAGLAQMYRNDPMSQFLGLNRGPGGQTPPADVMNGGNYTVNGQPAQQQAPTPAPNPSAPAPADGSVQTFPVTPPGADPAPAQPPMASGGAALPPSAVGAGPSGQIPGGYTPQQWMQLSPSQRIAAAYPMVSPTEAMGLLASDPTGKTLAEENAHRSRPVVAGDNIFQPTGVGTFKLPDGVVAARETVKQADASTADQHEIVKVTDPATGAERSMTKAQALGLTGQQSGTDLLSQLKPEDQIAILRNAATSGVKSFAVNMHGANGQLVKGTINLGSGDGQPGFQSGQSPGLAAEQQARGKQLVEQRAQIEDDGNNALSLKARIGEMRQATQNFKSGFGAPWTQKLGEIGIMLGQDPDKVNARMGNIADMQAFTKESTQMAFDMTKTLGSREAAVVVDRAVKAGAGLTNQPEANKAILDVMEGVADWKAAKAQAAQAWADGHNGSIEGFQSYFNKANPITNYIHEVKATSPMPMGGRGGPPGPGQVVTPQSAPAAIPRGTVPVSLDDYLKSQGVH